MGFDNTVAIYQVVAPEDAFEAAATEAVDFLREAERRFPAGPASTTST